MAEKKAAKKTVKKAVPSKVLSDKELVLEKYESAECKELRDKFFIFDADMEIAVHSGLALSESDAWKKAARAVS